MKSQGDTFDHFLGGDFFFAYMFILHFVEFLSHLLAHRFLQVNTLHKHVSRVRAWAMHRWHCAATTHVYQSRQNTLLHQAKEMQAALFKTLQVWQSEEGWKAG
jgi:hypothetical protein